VSLKRKANPVSQTANPVVLGDRVAWWLRSVPLSAKEVARLVGASEGTGKRLRAGVPPTTEQMTKLSQHFGWRFVSFVYEAVIGPDDETLAADLDEIRERLARLESADELDREADAAIPPMAGALASAPGRVVASVARRSRRGE
jgi:hypothetical protein